MARQAWVVVAVLACVACGGSEDSGGGSGGTGGATGGSGGAGGSTGGSGGSTGGSGGVSGGGSGGVAGGGSGGVGGTATGGSGGVAGGGTGGLGGTATGGAPGDGGVICDEMLLVVNKMLEDAKKCSSMLGVVQCSGTAVSYDSCGCKVVLNETQPAKVKAAQDSYDAWVKAGCGPFACGKACFEGTTGECQAGVGGDTCVWK